MCQCFKISHIFAAHFSLGLGRWRWGIIIEIISCDKRFPSTQIWFSSALAPSLFRGIARPALDWLMTSLSHCISHQEMLPFQILLVVVVFHMRSRSWAGFHRLSLKPLFTSSQFLNDECLFALREFATKHKFRWEKMRKKKNNLRLYEWMVNVCWHQVTLCGLDRIFSERCWCRLPHSYIYVWMAGYQLEKRYWFNSTKCPFDLTARKRNRKLYQARFAQIVKIKFQK